MRVLINQIRVHWKEIAFFSGYFILLLIASPMDISQANLGDKSAGFLYQSISLDWSFKSPLYTLLGWLVTRLPVRDAFSMIFFLSIIPAVATNILVYTIVKKETGNSWNAFIGSLVLTGSSVYFLQAQKIEAYTLASFLIILGLFLIYCKKFWLSSTVLGLGVLVHPYAIFGFVLLTSVFLRKKSFVAIGIVLIAYCVMSLFKDSFFQQFFTVFSLPNTWSFFSERMLYLIASSISIFSVGVVSFIFFIIYDNTRDIFFYFYLAIISVFIGVSVSAAPGANVLAIVMPIFAIIAGIGVKYISHKKIMILCCCIVLIVTVANFSIRFKDNINGETYSRRLLNDLSVTDDGSLVVISKVRDSDNSYFADGYFIQDAIKYNNFLQHKKIFAVLSNNPSTLDIEGIKKDNHVKNFYYVRAMNDIEEILIKE